MTKKTSPNSITSLTQDWGNDTANGLPFSGQAVQDFIKNQFGGKVGYQRWVQPSGENFYYLQGFATEADAAEYDGDPEAYASLLLCNIQLPISTVQGDSFSAFLYGKTDTTTEYVVSGGEFKVSLRFCAVQTSNGERLNAGERGTLTIQRSTDNGTTWTTVETRTGALASMDYASETFTDVDLYSALISGKQMLRVRASYQYTDADGSTKTATSANVIIGESITRTTLSLECQQNWQTPIAAATYATRGFPISYMVYGAVAKTLHVEITGGNNTTLAVTYDLTADDDSTVITKNVTDSTDTYKLFTHGVRTVKAWLTCDDGQGGMLSSDVLVNRFMVVNPTADADYTTPYLLLQNVIGEADNYAQTDICQYAVYSPNRNEDGTVTNDGAAVTVIFYLTAYAETFPDDNPTEYVRIEQSVSPGTQNTLNTTIEIESEATSVPAYFRVWRKDGDSEVNFMLAATGQKNTVITVDNSESYAPVSGADFLLNPRTRNNSETAPETIINARTGETVESTWEGFGLVKDGWVTSDVDGQRVLRIPAGAKLNFKYNPFAQFLTTADSACEIELDFMVRNVTNEDDPIVSLFEALTTTDADGNTTSAFRGLKMQPLHGEIHTKSNAVSSETDFNWREGVRTHLCVNIHNAVAPNKNDALVPSGSTYKTSETKIALVRVFIDGDIEREFKYSITDGEEFCTGDMSNGGFTLGQDGADLDIYSIRIYQSRALESNEVLGNYISTLPTTAEKQSVRARNNILTSGKVDITKCKALGIRCLVWHGVEPYKENTSEQTGYWEVFQYDKQGNALPEYSGTLCKETASLATKRQGSTANTYFYSNIQTKMGDVEATIDVPLTQLHSSISYTVNADAGTVSLLGGNLGKNFPTAETTVDYPLVTVNGVQCVTVPDGWVDGNGYYRGKGYIVAEGTPMAQKLVNKINYASSMQSHLTGVNNLYNDLHKAIVGKNSLQQAYAEARVSKYTEPFLYFTQALDSDTPIYRGPCTFGAGKMDKPTWGYVKKLHPMFTMIEGSDNNYELTDMRVPFTWGETDCPENITYRGGDYEGFFYNTGTNAKQCLDFDAGKTQDDAEETPSEDLIKVIQDTWNFLFLHNPSIAYYNGTFDAFQVSDAAKNTFNKYWCTEGNDAYLLKRYDFVDSKWVDAGLWDATGKKWNTVDIRTDEITASTYSASSNQSEYAALNTEIIGAVVAHAKKYIGFYFKESSLRLYYTFVIHLMAGTDSCSKNTYFVLDPTAVDVTIDGETRSCYLFEMHTDDVDTVLPIDNNGRSTKPYYIDRMHPYVDGDTTTEKYEGMHNVLFNLCEQMWEGTKELQSMAKSVFTAMEGLVNDSDYIEGFPSGLTKTSVYGCLWKYVYYVQKYIPQVAYNEAARIRYEYPEMIGFVSYGSGARGVRPITQSNGSLMECELQFIERRLVLMASYAAWGPFFDGKSGNLGISDATESFSMQAFHLPGEASSQNNYSFTVTPHQYFYPTGMMGQTAVDPHVRVAPGESYTLNLGSTTSNDTGLSVNGINYLRSIGNVGDLSTTPANTITFNGKRLTEIIAEPSQTYTNTDDSGNERTEPAFRPGAVVVSARNVKSISLYGCTATTGAIDLSELSRLESVDVRQTKLTDITLPETHTLTAVRLPATMTAVNVTNQANLSTLTLEGYANLTKYVVKGNTKIGTFAHATGLYAVKPANLKTVEIDHIDWTSTGSQCNVDMLMYLADLGASLKGVIYMLAATSDKPLALAHKITLCSLYGDIDSESNALYIKYDVRAINRISISGEPFMTTADKDYRFSVVPSPVTGNNIAIEDGKLKITFALSDTASPYAYWKDANTGLLHVTSLSDAALDLKHTMSATATTMAGDTLTTERQVGFYRHIPKVGDFAYADGTFDSDWDENRELVGQVFMRIPVYDGATLKGYDVRVYAKENLQLVSEGDSPTTWNTHRWGLYPDNNSVNGFTSGAGDTVEQAIKDATSLSSVYDIPTIVNITTRWGGVNAYDGELHTVPSQATDTVLADTPTADYATYEATWKAYFAALDTLYKKIQSVNSSYTYSATNRAENEAIYTIAQTGTIASTDKETLTRSGWVPARACYNDLTSAASSNSVSSSAEYTTFKAAFQAVADMLNNGESYATVSDERIGPAWLNAWNYYYLGDATYLDDDQEDGFKVFPTTCGMGNFAGKDHTEKIVAHAKNIIGDYLQESWPTTRAELANAMVALKAANADDANAWRYEEFYYPAAYGCSLYEPDADALCEDYKKGNWYLPAQGELARILNFYLLGTTADKAATGANEARTPIIANANSKAGKSVLGLTSSWYWASCEGSAYNGWSVAFKSGPVAGWSGKCGSNYVRPCTAFNFTL